MTTFLRVLQPEARRLVTVELASGSVDRWPEDAWLPFVADPLRKRDLAAFDAACDELRTAFAPFDPAMDAWLAPRLHAALPLTRREAADPGVWRFLAVVHRPDVVRHRWENLSWATMRSRFWSVGTRHTSNAFARLWWIAEITRDGDDYTLTERVLAKQALAVRPFVRGWSAYRPAIEAYAEVLADEAGETLDRAARDLSRHLGTVPLEGLTAGDLKRVLGRITRRG